VAKAVSKSFESQIVVDNFSTRIIRGDRVGIVGPNGAGKTTLLRLLTGRLEPDRGEIRIGTNLSEVTLDQTRATLDPAATLSETLTGGAGDQVLVGDQKRHVIGYMKDFLFRPEQARTAVGVLSGGERGRLMLAVALARPSNLMVLDEPTNDLDLETLDLLQEMLAEYQGTVLLVSHDRDFLDRVVTSTIAAEGGGRWTEYAGGYSDMLAQRGAASAPVAGRAQEKGRAGRPAPKPQAKKLSFKDRHALEQLPAEIRALQVQIRRHQQTLADGTLYKKDAARFAAESSALSRAEQALVTAEERWLELEMLREEVGG
jgi:ATP-binding cassette subfamily F protein uup